MCGARKMQRPWDFLVGRTMTKSHSATCYSELFRWLQQQSKGDLGRAQTRLNIARRILTGILTSELQMYESA